MSTERLLELKLELERLDHQWTIAKNAMLIHGKGGGLFEPTAAWAWWHGGVFLTLGVLFLVPGSPLCGGASTLLLGLIGLGGGFYALVRRLGDAKRYAASRLQYVARREHLLGLIAAAEPLPPRHPAGSDPPGGRR